MKYIVHPGVVTSRTDGQRHFVSFNQLVSLYGVDVENCIFASDKTHKISADDVHLWPKYNGDYTLPSKPAEEERG